MSIHQIERKLIDVLSQGAAAMNIHLTQGQTEQFVKYYQILVQWNQEINLTRISDPEAVVVKHFLDSLSCLLALPHLPPKVIDVGTGPGFPGMALKIVQPHIELTLLESVGKKVAFLTDLATKLELQNVHIIYNRAEILGQDLEHREHYDLALARAVAELRVLAEYLLPLLKLDGLMLAQKGQDPASELASARQAITILGGQHSKTAPVAVPGLDAERHLVLIQKQKPTPKKYPRRAGVPAKRPL